MAAPRSQVTAPASGLHARSTVPSAWSIALGTTWQVSHPSASRSAPVRTCDWCAPTSTAPVLSAPVEATGGAAFAAEPWHALQASAGASISPSMCLPPAASTTPLSRTVPGWQRSQAGFDGWGGGGGLPWHVPHAVCPSFTAVQIGAVFEPPAPSVPPWHQVAAQVAAPRSQTGAAPCAVASAPNASAARPSMCPGASTRSGTTWQSSQARAPRR